MNKENDELIRGKRRLLNIYEDSSNISKEDIDKVLKNNIEIDLDNKTLYMSSIYNKEACKNCNNNPKNGESGICNCILGIPELT